MCSLLVYDRTLREPDIPVPLVIVRLTVRITTSVLQQVRTKGDGLVATLMACSTASILTGLLRIPPPLESYHKKVSDQFLEEDLPVSQGLGGKL